MPLIECVPNVSEGRRDEVLAGILAALGTIDGVRLLDHGSDPDHNRSVVTFAGPSQAVGEAAFHVVRAAAAAIDLRGHAGVHPRMGATDVLPFVPLEGSDMGRCVRLAHAVGERIADELGIPVYFYGHAALDARRVRLADVRRGGFEELRAALERGDPTRRPDRGPTDALHPTAGATAVGARDFLIAFNVNLATSDVGVASAIARRIRESSGGLAGIRALGFAIEEGRVAQVSMNVCEHRRTGLVEVFDAIRGLAAEHGVAIRDSELVGLAPRAALDAEVARHVRLRDFDPRRSIVEERLR